MSTFGERIKKARLEAGLSQEALAKAMSQILDNKKISRTAITQWESSKTKGIDAANLLKATKILNVAPDWLQFGRGSMRPVSPDGLPSSVRFIPLLSFAQAVNHIDKEKEIISNLGLDEELAKIASPHAFALLIKDNSMASFFIPGDIIIVDPQITPRPGEFVVVKLASNHEVLFRKYRPYLNEGSSQFELISCNEDWGKIFVKDRNEGEIIGTLIEHRCKRRVPTGLAIF
jgi:SOS-response transcriptional repressor LexA